MVSVHQGSVLSLVLFILCMDTQMADLQMPHSSTHLYADDTVLANADRTALQQQMQKWKNRLGENGIKSNITEYLQCGPQTDGTIHIDEQGLNKTTQFKYLGSLVTSEGNTQLDAQLTGVLH